MIKETMTEKMIKRFYGITGPLDEQKRQEAERMGNIGFMWLFYILIIGNLIAILLGSHFPKLMVWAYPLFLEVILLILAGYIIYRSRKNQLTTIDEDNLSVKEQKQLKYSGLKAGVIYGVIFFFLSPLMDSILDGNDFYMSLLSTRNIFTAIFQAVFFGAIMHLLVYLRIRKARQEAEKND